MSRFRHAWRLFQLLFSNPAETVDRIEDFLQLEIERLRGKRVPQNYPSQVGLEDAIRILSVAVGRDLGQILGEPELHDIERHVARVTSELRTRAILPIPLTYSADATFSRLIYVVCRALEPDTVLETGVAYGVTSAAVLAALQKNGNGVLHSIDLPPLGDGATLPLIGCMIPPGLKGRWCLHLGSSKRVLWRLLAGHARRVGVFIHDSADIYRVQQMELRAVWPHLAPSFAIIANGIHSTPAFAEFVEEKHVQHWHAIRRSENPGYLIGLVVGTGTAPLRLGR